MFDGDLAGYDGRGATEAIIKDLKQVAPFGRTDTNGSEFRLTLDSISDLVLIHWRGEDSRHAFSGAIANGFFSRRASAAG